MNKKIELLNALTHAIGVFLGLIFLLMLISKSISSISLVGGIIYGICFILLFLSSTIYHSVSLPEVKAKLRTLDHSSIFLFIAGTYTPVILLLFTGYKRILLLFLIWGIALFGIFYKIFSLKKVAPSKKMSVALYIGMGWIAIFLIKPILAQTQAAFFMWIAFGGILYTGGTYFYKKTQWVYHHVIWHLFVLAAAISQFIGIYFYLI